MSSADPQRNDLEQDASSASAPANCSAIPFRILSQTDLDRLDSIVQLLEKEAQTWREGFAAWKDGQYVWTHEYPEVHVRVIRLESAQLYLLKLKAKWAKKLSSPNVERKS